MHMYIKPQIWDYCTHIRRAKILKPITSGISEDVKQAELLHTADTVYRL